LVVPGLVCGAVEFGILVPGVVAPGVVVWPGVVV
jgi:hypothetical protein